MPASPAVRRRTVGATVLAGLVVTAGKLVADTLAGTSAVGPVDALAYAAKSKLRGARPFPAEVVVVAVDEASIRALGRFPWPRSVFARLTDKLAGAGAQAVGFDIVFAEPEGRPELARLESEVRAARGALGTGASPAALDRLDRAAQALAVAAGGDAAFADALRRFGRAVLGFALVPPEDATARGVIDADAAALDAHAGVAPLSAVRVVSGFRTEAPVRQRAAHALLPLPPLPELVAAAGAAGAINTVADGDGEVRGVMLVAFDRGGHAFPSLALAAVARSGELALRRFRPLAWATDDSGVERLATPWGDGAGASVPLSATGRMLLSFYGPLLRPDGSPVVPTWSAAAVLQGDTPKGAFAGKIVFVGSTAIGLYDQLSLPLDKRRVPGVYVHATAAANLLRREFLARPPAARVAELATMVLLAIGGALAFARLRPLGGVAVLVAAAPAVFAVDALWLFRRGLLVHPTWPILELVAMFLVAATLRTRAEEREKRLVREAFRYYLDPTVMEDVLARPDLLRLGGEKRDLTVLFSDIRGFTTLAEQMPPEELVRTMNDYLTPMTQIVFKNRGTLDKYIGDAVMAFWGAPREESEHAILACRSAVEMLAELERLNGRFRGEGRPTLEIGIGIHTGPASVGNMGSQMRFNYTVMGDTVNLASRLEGTNKEFGTRAIISEATLERCRDRVEARELGSVHVKGRAAPVRIFELRGVASGG